jgi:hypothetical protein
MTIQVTDAKQPRFLSNYDTPAYCIKLISLNEQSIAGIFFSVAN